jgi:hypothetical protein
MPLPRRKTGTTPRTKPSKAKRTSKRAREKGGLEITYNGVRVEASPELEAAVRRACAGAAAPLPREMTTTQAAAYLDVSRPFVIKLTRRG